MIIVYFTFSLLTKFRGSDEISFTLYVSNELRDSLPIINIKKNKGMPIISIKIRLSKLSLHLQIPSQAGPRDGSRRQHEPRP